MRKQKDLSYLFGNDQQQIKRQLELINKNKLSVEEQRDLFFCEGC